MTAYQHNPELGIGRCPCIECVRYDYDAMDDDRPTWSEFLRQAREDYLNERDML